MLKGGITFLNEENMEQLKDQIPPDLLEVKKKELEMRRVEAHAPPLILIPNAWYCMGCTCINADYLNKCSECEEVKPEGKELMTSRESAEYWQRRRHEEKLEKIRDEMRTRNATPNNQPPAA